MGGVAAAGGMAGTLAFLFTDIEGHTPLWDEHPEEMAVALREHDEVIAKAVDAGGGRVVKSGGDGAMVVFGAAEAAVGAALVVQEALAARSWPEIGSLSVRMGIHVGSAQERDGDFFGPDVIRAARLCNAAHGGQVVASRAAAELAQDVEWRSLGDHTLRGLSDPVEVMQVEIGRDFPPLRTVDAHPNSLPRFRTTFLGREEQVAEIADLLGTHRIVTVTGVGGCGKTRLAVEVAHASLASFTDGAYFVDLAPVGDGRVWDAVAAALQLVTGGLGPSDPPAVSSCRFLARRQALLVVDNCEHLLDEVADVVEQVLDECPAVVVLATSREGLHVEGERMLPVPSLGIDQEAIPLFVERAEAAGAESPDPALVRRICERLDGIPLAIELAAGRCAQLGAAGVADRLDDRFRLLTGGRRRVQRQRTLEATLDWSYELLDEQEQAVLAALSVFSGGFTLEAAEVVAGASFELVAGLVERSLVQRGAGDRFHLLETVRAYAADKLRADGRADAVREAHHGWVVALGDVRSPEAAMPQNVDGTTDSSLLDDLDNVTGAVDWSVGREDWPGVVRLAEPWTLVAANAPVSGLVETLGDRLLTTLEQALDEDLRWRALVAYLRVGFGTVQPDVWNEAVHLALATEEPDRRVDSIEMLCWAANGLDAVSRFARDEAGIERAQHLVEVATQRAVSGSDDPRFPPEFMAAVLDMNGQRWVDASDRLDRLLLDGDASVPSLPPSFVLWTWSIVRYGAGRPLAAHEILGRGTRTFWDPDGGPGFLELTAAACAVDSERDRPALVVSDPVAMRRSLDRYMHVAKTSVLILAARIAVDEGHVDRAARWLSASRDPGPAGIFSTPPGVALYRLTMPDVRAALDDDQRRLARAEGAELGVAGALDDVVDWLTTR